MVLSTSDSDVQLVRFPVEVDRLRDYRRRGIPRLLVVEAGHQAPLCTDLCEDWVRAPVSHDDLQRRIISLQVRKNRLGIPKVDPTGMLHFGNQSIALSPTQTELLEELVENFGALTSKAALNSHLPCSETGKRNALHLHVMRIRRRIEPLGLVLRTVRGRGYLLESAEDVVT